MKKNSLLLIAVLLMLNALYAQEVVKLYPGKAPGSESWNWEEQDLGGGYLRDVVDPTLTIDRKSVV